MSATHLKKVLLLPILATTMLAAGCLDAMVDHARRSWIWVQDPDDGPALAELGPTSEEKIESAQKLIDRASSESNIQQTEVVSTLLERIREEQNPVVREEIIRASGKLKTTAIEGMLTAALQDEDVDVRVAACEAWGMRGRESAVSVLAEALASQTERDVRIAAAKALGKFSGRDDSGFIERSLGVGLEDTDITVQFRTMESLKAVSGQDYGHDAAKWREYVQSRSGSAASESIASPRRDEYPYQ